VNAASAATSASARAALPSHYFPDPSRRLRQRAARIRRGRRHRRTRKEQRRGHDAREGRSPPAPCATYTTLGRRMPHGRRRARGVRREVLRRLLRLRRVRLRSSRHAVVGTGGGAGGRSVREGERSISRRKWVMDVVSLSLWRCGGWGRRTWEWSCGYRTRHSRAGRWRQIWSGRAGWAIGGSGAASRLR
jgi:hypothetical protein